MLGTVLALVAAVAYGASDFLGGLTSRRVHFLWVGVLSQAAAALVGLLLAVLGPGRPGADALLWGGLAGLGSALGTGALYAGLATGRMAVAGPLSAVGSAGVPVIAGLAFGDRLGWSAAIAVALALPGILLTSLQGGSGTPTAGRRRGVGVGAGLLAGLGFGLLFVGLGHAAPAGGSWPVEISQTVAALALGLALAVAAARGGTRPEHPRRLWLAVPVGLLALAATVLFRAAAGRAPLAVVGVIGSLYPAATVLLAVVVLHERPRPVQLAGLVLCAASVVVFAAG